MVAIAMTAHVEELVLDVVWRVLIELVDLVLEALPLCQVVVFQGGIGGVGAVDEAEVRGHEIEGC